jgi:hypothetical protein
LAKRIKHWSYDPQTVSKSWCEAHQIVSKLLYDEEMNAFAEYKDQCRWTAKRIIEELGWKCGED